MAQTRKVDVHEGCRMERVPDGKQIGLKLVYLNNYLMNEESY